MAAPMPRDEPVISARRGASLVSGAVVIKRLQCPCAPRAGRTIIVTTGRAVPRARARLVLQCPAGLVGIGDTAGQIRFRPRIPE